MGASRPPPGWRAGAPVAFAFVLAQTALVANRAAPIGVDTRIGSLLLVARRGHLGRTARDCPCGDNAKASRGEAHGSFWPEASGAPTARHDQIRGEAIAAPDGQSRDPCVAKAIAGAAPALRRKQS
jgi:hypothetical protein